MKEVLKDWRKLLSMLLIAALLVQESPVQAFAAEREETVAAQQETAMTEPEEAVPEPMVIGEAESLREEDVKHFLNSDGSFTAVKYAQPVHYRQTGDAAWQDIDNTLSLDETKSGEFSPASSPLDVSLASSFHKDKIVSVRNAGHELSWSYLKANTGISDSGAAEIQAFKSATKTIQAKKLDLEAEVRAAVTDVGVKMPDKLADGLVYPDVFPNVDGAQGKS